MEFLQSVGILDIIFIAILAISTLIGLIRGAVREILSLVGLAAAIYLAFKFADMISKEYVSQFFEQPRISYIIAFVLIIVVTIFAVALINLLISQLLKASGLSFVNRFMGLVFGALRGAVLSAVLVMVIGFIPGATQANWWKASALAPFFQTIASRSIKYLPKEVADYFNADKPANNPVQTPTTGKQPATTDSVRPKNTGEQLKDDVKDILQSIDGSLKETQKPSIQLESGVLEKSDGKTPPDNSTPNTTEKKEKLTLESYQ